MEIINIILKLIPLISLLAFIKAIVEYRKNQIWKESEFLSKEVKEFFSDERVKIVLSLLDWNSRKIMILGKEQLINDSFIIESLKTHNVKSKFSLEEAYIRDLFDNFFDKLSFFNIHCKNGLLDRKKVFNYFEYYFNILTTSERKSAQYIKTINSYLNYYDFNNVIDLLNEYKKERRKA
jgi:hypothetical protein